MKRPHPDGVGLVVGDLRGGETLQTGEPVGPASTLQLVEPVELAAVCCQQQLTAPLVGNAVVGAKLVKCLAPFEAEA